MRGEPGLTATLGATAVEALLALQVGILFRAVITALGDSGLGGSVGWGRCRRVPSGLIAPDLVHIQRVLGLIALVGSGLEPIPRLLAQPVIRQRLAQVFSRLLKAVLGLCRLLLQVLPFRIVFHLVHQRCSFQGRTGGGGGRSSAATWPSNWVCSR